MVSSDSIRGFIDLIILSLLNEEDMYGYLISKQVAEKTNFQYELHEATLYAVLNRLVTKNAIVSYQGEISHGSKRKYYKITNFGKKYLGDLQENYLKTKEIVDKFVENGGKV